MHLALDIDGTITAAPEMLAALAAGTRSTEGTVTILHGVKSDVVTPEDVQEARTKLLANGFSGMYDTLKCVPQPVAMNKAIWAKQNAVDLFVDNRKKNVKRARALGVNSWHFK